MSPFTIRGFVAEIRKKDKDIGYPFPTGGVLLPPIRVPNFRFWRWEDRIPSAETEIAEENGGVPDPEKGDLAPNEAHPDENGCTAAEVPDLEKIDVAPNEAHPDENGCTAVEVPDLEKRDVAPDDAHLDEDERIAREALLLLRGQQGGEEETVVAPDQTGTADPYVVDNNDDDDDDDATLLGTETLDDVENAPEHTDDEDSEPEWIDIEQNGSAEAKNGKDVAVEKIEVHASENVNQEDAFPSTVSHAVEASTSATGMSGENNGRMDGIIRKTPLASGATELDTLKNKSVDAVTEQTSEGDDSTSEDEDCVSRSRGTNGKRKRRKKLTLDEIMSRCASTSDGGSPQGLNLSPLASAGGGALEENLNPSTSNGGAALEEDNENPSTSNGGRALDFDLNVMPTDAEAETVDSESTEPPVTENHAEGEVQGTSVNDQTVFSSKEKGEGSGRISQGETSRFVQKENNAESEHCGAESVSAEPEVDESSRRATHSGLGTLQVRAQMSQIMNGKLPLLLPENPANRPSILLRGSAQRGNRASGNQDNSASQLRANAASERAVLDSTTDPMTRRLNETAQPVDGTSSRCNWNQNSSYTNSRETAANHPPVFFGSSSRDGGYQRPALSLNQERPSSVVQLPLGASSSRRGGGYPQLTDLVGSSSYRNRPVSWETWNRETRPYRSQPLAGSLADLGHRLPQSCLGTSQAYQTSRPVSRENYFRDDRLAQSSARPRTLLLDNRNGGFSFGSERNMGTPPQHPYGGRDGGIRFNPNAGQEHLPATQLRGLMDAGTSHRIPVHVNMSHNHREQSSMHRDHNRLDMSRLDHSRSNRTLFPQPTSNYFNRNHYPGSSSGISPVPQENMASFLFPNRPSAVPVREVSHDQARIIDRQKGTMSTPSTTLPSTSSLKIKDSANQPESVEKRPEIVVLGKRKRVKEVCQNNENPSEKLQNWIEHIEMSSRDSTGKEQLKYPATPHQ